MKKETLAYMAGIIDGEGSIRIELQRGQSRGHPDYYRLRLSVANTDILLMDWLVKNFKCSSLKEKKRIGNRKQNYQWEVKAPRQVGVLMKTLYPYLVVKKRRAEVALEVAKLMKGSRYTPEERIKLRELYLEMRILNKRGTTEPARLNE